MTINKNEIMEQLKKERSYDLEINKEYGAIIFKYSSIYSGVKEEYKLLIYKLDGKFENILETKYVQDIEKIFTILEIADFN